MDDDPVNYIREVNRSWKEAIQQVELDKSATIKKENQSLSSSNCEDISTPDCSQTSPQTPFQTPSQSTSAQTPFKTPLPVAHRLSISTTQANQSNQLSKDNRQNELIKNDNPLLRTVFVFKEFNGDLFKQVDFHTKSIIGLTALRCYFNNKTVSALLFLDLGTLKCVRSSLSVI